MAAPVLPLAEPAEASEDYATATAARDGCRKRIVEPVRPGDPVRPHRRHRRVRAVISVLVAMIFAAEVFWLIPHVRSAGHALTHPRLGWFALACVAEVSSMTTFARLQRSMLRAGGIRVRISRAIAVTFAANAMSVTLPAGPVASSAYTFRRMRSWGASNSLVAFGMVASGALSTIALAGIAVVGAALAGHKPNAVLLILEIVAFCAGALALRRLSHRPDLLLRLGSRVLHRANRLRRRDVDSGEEQLRGLLEELVLIHPRTVDWLRGLMFASLNWIADLVCLIAACRAVGAHGPSLGVALVAYAAGMAASSLPLLPGGLGLVDGALILALTRGGLSPGVATAGVIAYRLISFVMVAIIGWIAWLLIRRGDLSRNRANT